MVKRRQECYLSQDQVARTGCPRHIAYQCMYFIAQKRVQIKINKKDLDALRMSSNENVELYRAQDLFHQNIPVIM